uniref:Uncharacterized protein n=1 Tax=Phlebotomus papatasi TaxID=29031 RepID=A0A1B0DBT3_PHLPP
MGNIQRSKYFESQIVGGDTPDSDDHRYIVSLRLFAQHFCGGFIVSSNKVVTAAQCTFGRIPSSITVVVGSNYLTSGGLVYTPMRIAIHDRYIPVASDYDVSVLEIPSISFNRHVFPIRLGSNFIGAGVAAIVAGWGSTGYPSAALSDSLQVLEVETWNNPNCETALGVTGLLISERNICAGGLSDEGVCGGDTGGPLVVAGEAIGIVSWGIPCGRGYPDVYARVSFYRDWILNQFEDS